ncbi:DUF3833 family protein [Sphingomonas sp. TREG-RG-20F-R18-01]|uniref:DUF3833 family protein n=1 Tax=Sphingomonas sp. TREG-RG-20F-R18-01 TaxID=2914982 RepID=UPI001F5AD585|nr:DUF3833 family protein [Sphingomonas sp. TREG-RG-20F-R18-01]
MRYGYGIIALLSGSALVPALADAATPEFSPTAFFAGRTEGEGVFHRIASRHKATHVQGTGTLTAPDTIVLAQHVVVEGKPPRDRQWTLHAVGGGKFDGRLTDAIGPVRGDVAGNRFHVRFRLKGGFDVQQWMYLQPGGKVVQNHLVVRKFGIRVAALDETIRKLS